MTPEAERAVCSEFKNHPKGNVTGKACRCECLTFKRDSYFAVVFSLPFLFFLISYYSTSNTMCEGRVTIKAPYDLAYNFSNHKA